MMLFVPLPPPTLDMLIATNITLSVFVLMISLFMRQPLDFSSFPTLLLVLTVYQLAINAVSTRLILSRPDRISGKGEAVYGLEKVAGNVIPAIAKFVIAGNPVVGLVILVIILFVVVTRGATRIA